MCGIFGIFGTNRECPVERGLLEAMGDALVHRGPDGSGFFCDGPFGMGMRRLSIIDLATGDQPLANEDGTVWVVFNGEIYNYRELRTELAARGHRFTTASDTEVLVHLYEERGEDCVSALRGMFSFAIWDASHRSLFLARDHLGIKPLYYAQSPHGFVFGSELKAIVKSPWIAQRVDANALVAYLQYGYVPDPLSIFEGVAKLPPGHTLMVRDGRPATPRRYWETRPFFRRPMAELSEEEAAAELWDRLSEAVRSQLVSDVPLGAFLSGGVDSTTVVAIMARELGLPVKTFSVGFRERGYNELPYARQVAERFETDHHELLVESGDLSILEDVLTGFDEPFSDASAIPTYLVSRLARAHVKVVLSGDGGDELFAGYDRYLVDRRRRFIGLAGDSGLGTPLRGVSRVLPEGTPGKNFLYNLSLPRGERYLDAISLFPPRSLDGLLEPGARPAQRSPVQGLFAMAPELDALSQLQDLDLRTYLPGDILTKVDRMSMANSLEARVPLLDHSLAEYACALPVRFRLRGRETKYLLKRLLRGRVPDEVLTRPKQGFGVPLEVWFSTQQQGFFRDQLGSAKRLGEIGIRPAAVRSLLDLYDQWHRSDHCRRLWALVVLDRSLAGLAAAGAQ
jgi:asparagine synthase (glutamine-hydrolysing)